MRAPSRLILRDLRLEAVGPELEAMRAEGVGLDDVGPRLEVVLVDAAHEVGVREVQLVEAAVHEHAAGVQHRAHGAVADHDAFGRRSRNGLTDAAWALLALTKASLHPYRAASCWMSFRIPAAVTSAPAPGPVTTSGSAR